MLENNSEHEQPIEFRPTTDNDQSALLATTTFTSKRLLLNFLLFSCLYSITQGTVDSVLAFSSAELGANVGSTAGFVLYIFYTLSALLLAKPVLRVVLSKYGVLYGLVSYLIYILSFFVALSDKRIESIFIVGAAIGGIGGKTLY